MHIKLVFVLFIPLFVAACGPAEEPPPAERIKIFGEMIEKAAAERKERGAKKSGDKKDNLFVPYFEMGKAYHELKNNPKAIENFKAARRSDTTKFFSSQGYQKFGQALYAEKKYEDAKAMLEEALPAKPGDTGILSDLGAVYLAMGMTEQAIQSFEQVLGQDGRHTHALNGLGSAYLQTGKTEEAIEQFQKALAVNPGFTEARNNLAVAYDTAGKYDDAIRVYEELLKENPKNKAARYNLGAIYIKQGEYQKAETELKRVATAGDTEAKTYTALGLVYEKLNNPDRAQNAYNQAIQLDSNNSNLYRLLGNFHYKNKNVSDAISAYKQAVKLDPKSIEVFRDLSILYDKINDGMSAARYLTLAERNSKEANKPEQTAEIHELLQAIFKKYSLKPGNIVIPPSDSQDF